MPSAKAVGDEREMRVTSSHWQPHSSMSVSSIHRTDRTSLNLVAFEMARGILLNEEFSHLTRNLWLCYPFPYPKGTAS